MKYAVLAVFSVLPVAATAQTAPSAPAAGVAAKPAAVPTAGSTVIGKDNQPVGTIAQVTAEAIVIDTGTNKVPVPVASIGTNPKGYWIGMTKAELDAAYAQAAQQALANLDLSPGKMVHGLNDAMIGTIKTADAQFVTVTTGKGEVKLPRNGFGPGTNNTVRVNATAEQIDAAVAGAAPAASGATPAAGATSTATTTNSAAATTGTDAAAPTATDPNAKKAPKPKN